MRCVCVCVSLRLRSIGASYWEQKGPREFCKCPRAGVGFNAAVCTSNSSGIPASGICMSRCQLLGDWDPGTATGQTEVLRTADEGIHTVCMYACMYMFSPVELHSALPVK